MRTRRVHEEMTMGRNRILCEGILVGLAGAAAVAIWFFVYDLALATPFRTPALLGAVLFEGLRDPAALTITPGILLQYTAGPGRVSARWFSRAGGSPPRGRSRRASS